MQIKTIVTNFYYFYLFSFKEIIIDYQILFNNIFQTNDFLNKELNKKFSWVNFKDQVGPKCLNSINHNQVWVLIMFFKTYIFTKKLPK